MSEYTFSIYVKDLLERYFKERDHSFSTYVNVSKKLTFLTPCFISFSKMLRTYEMNDPKTVS